MSVRTAGARTPLVAGHPRLHELTRFGAVGALSTVIYLGAYGAGLLAGTGFVLAAVAAFLISAVCGYVLHDRWTFRTNAATRIGLARWLALQGTVLVLNVVALAALVTQLGFDRFVAQVILLPLIPLLTYVLSRRHVFGAA